MHETHPEAQTLERLFDISLEGGIHVLSPKKTFRPTRILDPGLQNTAIARSSIGRIDASRPAIYYRGHDLVGAVVGRPSLDVARLLITGGEDESGNRAFLHQFQSAAKAITDARPDFLRSSIAQDPIDHLLTAILWTRGHSRANAEPPADPLSTAATVLAAAALAVASYRAVQLGQVSEFLAPRFDELKTLAAVLLIGSDAAADHYSQDLLEEFLVLHAEHGMNCSTTTVRAVASARSDPYSAIVAGICAFRGPLHGGASELVGRMLDELHAAETPIDAFIDRIIDERKRLMGFGHRIYATTDPRASYMHRLIEGSEQVFAKISPSVGIAYGLMRAVQTREYFTSRFIYPNPDLFNGLLLRRAGFPSSMNTMILCCSRIAGWLAHYFESAEQVLPIIRPCDL